jgi:hypothetical protein
MLSLVQVLLLALLDYHRRAAAIHDSQALHRSPNPPTPLPPVLTGHVSSLLPY